MKKHSDFKTILDLAQQLLELVQMPLFGDKHSKKTFAKRQKMKNLERMLLKCVKLFYLLLDFLDFGNKFQNPILDLQPKWAEV